MSHQDRLELFIGSWDVQAVFAERHPVDGEFKARTSFEWILDGAFLLQRSEIDHPDAPDAYAIVAPNSEGDGYTQHYYDSRGVVRLYEMSFDGRIWTLTREKPDFSPLEFMQRYTGSFDEDGRAIRGTWEIRFEGQDWQKDFDLNYIRAD